MNPELLLSMVAAIAGFVLKTTLAFGLCLAFSWLVRSPNSRFMTWLGFLYGAGAYWLWLANGVLTGKQLSPSAPPAPVQSVTSNAGAWHIPGSWAFPLGIGLRALGIAYVLVLSYIFLSHLKKRRQLRWALGFTCKPPVEIAKAFQPLAESLHAGRSRLLVLPGATSPATFGWIRPTILLPDVCLERDRSELEDILRHELQHVCRWDSVWNGFAIVCRALLFFHPAAWYAVQKMQCDRELACDLAVVSHSPARRAQYAECLVHFARLNSSQDPKTWGIDFAASSEHLQARIHSILAESNKTSGWLFCLRTACGLTLLAGFLGIAPSLAVLLSYTHRSYPHRLAMQPLTSEIRPSQPGTKTGIKAAEKIRLLAPRTPASAHKTVASLSQPETSQSAQPTPEPTYRRVEDVSPSSSGPGPQLLRRHLPPGAPGNTRMTQQSVTLVDSGVASQIGKKGDSDRSNALQQSVLLAGGIYKRLADLKPEK